MPDVAQPQSQPGTAPSGSPVPAVSRTGETRKTGTRIHIKDLRKRFGSGSGKDSGAADAVAGVNLTIEPGELVFLLGPSGCGKTTLLRMIAGFIEPTAGRIRFGDIDVTDTPPNKRNTGMVFQSYALWPHMTVAQNVAFGLDVRHVDKEKKASAVAHALRAVQMEAYAERKPTQLSGGQQQRVALARALVIRPEVLLLDEPLSNLDAKLRNDLRLEIRRICTEAGLTTVYVTHDQKEAMSIADRIAIMRDGQFQQIGTPRELYTRPTSAFVANFLGDTNFLEATVIDPPADGKLLLETNAGRIYAAMPVQQTKYKQNDRVLCSIRPEAAQLLDTEEPGTLRGKRLQSVYLGDIAHHEIRVGPENLGTTLRVSELHPTEAHFAADQRQIGVRLDPADVVVLPHEPIPSS